jgi:hypothetical protein
MEGKENYILLMHALACLTGDALLALLGLTTETRPTHNMTLTMESYTRTTGTSN